MERSRNIRSSIVIHIDHLPKYHHHNYAQTRRHRKLGMSHCTVLCLIRPEDDVLDEAMTIIGNPLGSTLTNSIAVKRKRKITIRV